jgi:IS1 family transposase
MRTSQPLFTFLAFIAILAISWYSLRLFWFSIRFHQPSSEEKPQTPRLLNPKSEDDCPFYRAKKSSAPENEGVGLAPRPWGEVKSKRGRKKTICTQGYACHYRECPFYHVMNADIHALVGYGSHGKNERIQDLMCQACGKKFTLRRDTVLYRLKTHSERVAEVLSFMGAGVDMSTLEEVLGIGEGTLRTWQTRAGIHSKELHARFFQELIFRHIQLDELWANVRRESQEVWLWAAIEATSKVVPVLMLGPRTLEMAFGVVHELRHMMKTGCIPIFCTDGLKLYFYALTAHFGHWTSPEGVRKPVWEIAGELVYGQVKKIHRRRKLVRVERHMLCGELEKLKAGLKEMGLSGRISTAFIERINLTIRRGVSFLARRTWGTAQYTPELEIALEWWRAYYHFTRCHESLRVDLLQPVQRKGKRLARRYRGRTPAMAARLTRHRWTVLELISYPLP